MLVEQCGILLILQGSHSAGVDLINKQNQKDYPLPQIVAWSIYHLTEMDLLEFIPIVMFWPPLRSLQDQERLIRGVQEGSLDAICSAHRPLDAINKLAPLGETLPGCPH